MAFRTPKSNLVFGMTWFQQTFTQRINAGNRLRGHLFAGRYKAIPVENEDMTGSNYRSDYLSNLIQYIHLNPGRAKLVDGGEKPILNYQWGSLAQWYAVAPSKRPHHAQVAEGLDLLQFKDTVAGRRNYVSEIDSIIRAEIIEETGYFLPEEQSLQSTLERGWYWGSDFFKEQLIERFSNLIHEKSSGRHQGMSAMTHDHSVHQATKIIELAMKHFKMSSEAIQTNQRSDQRRNAIASVIAEQTTISHAEIAELLNMKNAANASQRINRFRKLQPRTLPKTIRQFLRMSKERT